MTTDQQPRRVRIERPEHGYHGMSGVVVRTYRNGNIEVEVEYRGHRVIVREDDVVEVNK